MDSVLKLVISLIVLTIVLNTSIHLLDLFHHYVAVRTFAGDIKTLGSTMKSLRSIGNNGSWQMVTINIPLNYSLFFNNVSDKLEVHGSEEYEINSSFDFIYALNLSSGIHHVQVYYGMLPFDKLENETVMFK